MRPSLNTSDHFNQTGLAPATLILLRIQTPDDLFLPSFSVPGTWSVDAEGIETIVRSLTPPRRQFGTMYDSESPDPDVRHDANMRTGYVKLYAEVSPLTPAHMSDPSIDWNSTRGWFDECVKAARYYDLCSGNEWTQKLDKIEDVSNSYRGLDFEEWEPQRERDQSLTLAPILENDGRGVLNVLEGLDEIELSGQLS
ncbi:hypothetical protein RSOLAG22IIIB_12765 [Rhizoctonia solani]|uniref:Uncharacterized protein n=1 Tax=Rhizoctonia solani TaxID=456999 RepID=A0A0K6GGT3_9AGAM|nr:hypothetical protein RSOLAG22IIIB_12765 [Rhizoctonia solani]